MSVFRKFLEDTYTADPNRLSRFAAGAYVLVRVRRRFWRGYRKMAEAKVTTDGGDVSEAAVTRPSWKLVPGTLKAEFDAMDREVETVLGLNCINRPNGGTGKGEDESDEGDGPVLVGGGTYAVDTAAWPRLEHLLRRAADKWGEAADRWCTEEGYGQLHAELQTQIGDADYARAKVLVPDRDALRRKFGLQFRRAPVRIVEDTGDDAGLAADRQGELIELFEMAVREPRAAAARAWTDLAHRLVDPATGAAYHPPKTNAAGEVAPGPRRITRLSALVGRRETEALGRVERYLDENLRALRNLLLTELPEAGGAQAVAQQWNADDAVACRVGRLLLAAAAAALDEAGMCLGFGAAVAGTA